jgi:NAD(P)H dehydrogenase (quinone)
MNALLVVANPGASSFSHAMAQVACEVIARRGGVVRLHDLYEESFDPVQRSGESGNRGSDDELVERHCADLVAADLILVFHPNWWGQPPAIMKGWIDRVFRPGVAYDYPPGTGFDGVPVGLLKAKAALVFNTSNTPRERETAAFGDPLQTLWQKCVFGLCGVTRFERRVFGPMASSTAEQRGLWLNDVAALVTSHF